MVIFPEKKAEATKNKHRIPLNHLVWLLLKITNWHLLTGDKAEIYKLANEGFYIYAAENSSIEGGFEHSGNFALIDKNGFIRSRKDDFGNPIIYYRGIVSEDEGTDDNGEVEQISILKEDIRKLLNE